MKCPRSFLLVTVVIVQVGSKVSAKAEIIYSEDYSGQVLELAISIEYMVYNPIQ